MRPTIKIGEKNFNYVLPDKGVYRITQFFNGEKIVKEVVLDEKYRRVKRWFGLKSYIEKRNPFTGKWEQYL